MGQYLAIGIVTKISVRKREITEAECTLEHLQDLMKHQLYHDPEIYVAGENEGMYEFKLNDEIFYTQLLPLLETLYPLLYKNADSYDYILKKLRSLPPSEWISWSNENSEPAFCFDKYGMDEFLRQKYTSIHLYYEGVMLSMEGKISMEEYGRHFKFVKYAMMRAFQQFRISGALRMYITG